MSIALLGKLRRARALGVLLAVAMLAVAGLAAVPAQARFTQQGDKLFGLGAVGDALQGVSVALSADGDTAIVGGFGDNGAAGAAWVFTRDSNGVWTQQGNKLVGTGAVGDAQQGISVALSADGDTAIVGGREDSGGIGAAWVFVRDGDGMWTQQGNKLIGAGAVGNAFQGQSVALSADGDTAIVGGHFDDGSTGAAWVFTRDSDGVWAQQGAKLVGAGAVGNAFQGQSVALSADGNTAIVGGPDDDSDFGAAWVFTRDGNGVWTQQGGKLVGADAVGNAQQGFSVALSADGDTALLGGPADGGAGAAWVFTRDGDGVWTQQGGKLTGAGAVGTPFVGFSVALSADGDTAMVGGFGDNGGVGAAWLFRRNRAGVWTQRGQKLVGAGAAGNAFQGTSVALSGDGSTAMVGGSNDNGNAGAVWVFGRPAVTEVVPSAGTVDGGTNVVILGRHLADVVSVTFGGVPATDVIELTPSLVFATTPPRAAGRVRVDVTTRTGRGRAKRAYTYRKHATVTSLSSSVNPSRLGQRVRFRAIVTTDGGAPASGSVTFKAGTQTLGTVALNGRGVARFSTTGLAAGRHRITAVFNRNGNFQRSADRLRQRVRN